MGIQRHNANFGLIERYDALQELKFNGLRASGLFIIFIN